MMLKRYLGTKSIIDEFFKSGSRTRRNPKIEIIAHRGSSGKIPAHTIPAYDEAVKAGADWIEFDTHSTKDGKLVLMHDIDLSLTTNVSQIFPKRKREIFAPCVDGEEENLHDWFVEDFTCAELKELSVSHQFLTRRFRGGTSGWTSRGVKLEGRLKIPTVFEAAREIQKTRTRLSGSIKRQNEISYRDDISRQIEDAYRNYNEKGGSDSLRICVTDRLSHEIDFKNMVQRNIASSFERKISRRHDDGSWTFQADENPDVGLYIETKRPSHYRSLGLSLEEKLVEDIEKSGFDGPIIVQSFERSSLELLRELKPDWKRVQLLLARDASRNERDVVNIPPTDEHELDIFLREISTYADGIGPHKSSIVQDPNNPPDPSSLERTLVDFAHHHDLFVHPYTFRTDVQFLPEIYHGNSALEFMRFYELGVDGVFADFPSHAAFARQVYERMTATS